ncbi:uncharacterized protein B0P05DRAFT_547562 [Gilbertella persicaria]|uniref:uncharacterized protein n=1 Tax=Gilbertella persicaria TaxID=101096 RepID=UPI00221FBA27|nr:uncharacterized protein B0P05DRAFT_547562 [Gilbertella persicaria]KAI8075451.1 hypothetical protein B0P05DRAFT_547562 [Gilbertella persicaria]
MISLSNDDFVLFDQISNEVVTSYVLGKLIEKIERHLTYDIDFVTSEYEAIIHCPSSRHHRNITDAIVENYFSNKKKKDTHFNDKSRSNFDHSGLPSPPLSASPERKSYKANVDYPPTPPDAPMSLRSYIEAVVKKSRISTGTLLASLAYARRLKLKLSRTSKGKIIIEKRLNYSDTI